MTLPEWAIAPAPGFQPRSYSDMDVVWANKEGEVIYQFGPHVHPSIAERSEVIYKTTNEKFWKPVIAAASGAAIAASTITAVATHFIK